MTDTRGLLSTLTALQLSRRLSGLLRWTFFAPTALIAEAVADADTDDEVNAFAITAVGFACWHRSRPDVHYGRDGTSLGRAMRQLGSSGHYGPGDPTTVRMLDQLTTATTCEDLCAAVARICTALSSAGHPPRWSQLATDLLDWQHSPDAVRWRWVRDFHRHTPHNATVIDNESDQA